MLPRTAVDTCPACGLRASRTYFPTGRSSHVYAANCACGRGEFAALFRPAP